MHSLDYQVLLTLQQWVEKSIPAWLCTIVATHGSSPRPAGSLMACNQQGQVVGSLSGGCVEDDLLEKLLAGAHQTLPTTVQYGLSAEENARLGLPCGGYLTVLIERMDTTSLATLNTINQALSERSCIERSVDLQTGTMQLRPLDQFAPQSFDDQRYVQVYGPRYIMLLVGAGQIAGCLALMADMMDYRVIITDPRPDKLDDFRTSIQSNMSMRGSNEQFECIQGMPDDVVRQYANDPFSIVITLTHDPRIDDMALMEALTLNNFYVGALGSMRTTEKRRERLQELQLTQQQIDRLHAPVGLPIGSKTAPEIAVAILAELTRARRIKN